MTALTKTTAWKNLEKHASTLPLLPFIPHRDTLAFYTKTTMITLDFSHQHIDNQGLNLLQALAKQTRLQEEIHAMMAGYNVNTTEHQPALHSALRVLDNKPLFINGHNIIEDILDTREKMRVLSTQLREGEWVGYTGKRIQAIVNIGIGGSHLGPQFCIHAMSPFRTNAFSYHFISDIDVNAFQQVLYLLSPETTLFLVSSKSFSTYETLLNTKKAMQWLNQPQHLDKHFIAITANVSKAKALGFNIILPLWDWIGGRYSICSAVNFITCIAIGFEAFCMFLKGAHEMDEHFHHAPLEKNIPILLALLGLWNNNFLHIHTHSILTYAQRLQTFYQHIQQLDMESNGKSIDKQGRTVNYATGPIIWGGSATQAQHSYYQLLCQGTHKITVDLLTMNTPENEHLNQICVAHKKAFTQGVFTENQPNEYIPGHIPLNHIELNENSPEAIGALIALYEHKIYAQSVMWNINPFNQPAVIGLKSLMNHYLKEYSTLS